MREIDFLVSIISGHDPQTGKPVLLLKIAEEDGEGDAIFLPLGPTEARLLGETLLKRTEALFN